MMQPRIEIIPEKKLLGKSIKMSFTENKTAALWGSFMPRRKEITNNIGSDLYSAEVYPLYYFENFDPSVQFNKWAAVEVSDFDTISSDMEQLILPEGLYAIFIHKGPANEGPRTYNYIFTEWLPSSGYQLDKRPHFAVMGDKYKQDDPGSEEEIWIPLKS